MTGSCGSGTRCVSGSCVCDSTSCGGCCSGGLCRSGNTNSACGSGGAACSVCSASQICGGGNSSNPCINATLLQATQGGYGNGAHKIVIDPAGQYVYFLDQNNSTTNMQIWRVPTAGGSGQVVASALNWPASIAVDSANLYWTSLSDSTVVAQSLSTGIRRVLATAQYYPMDIAVRDATTVYWTACLNSNGTQCSVWSIPVSGGSPTSLYSLSGGGNPSLALLVPNLYVTSNGLRQVVSISIAPGGSNSTVDSVSLPYGGVDARAGRVAWFAFRSTSGSFDGLVKGMSVGGTSRIVGSGQAPYAVAVDSTHAYWVTEAGTFEEAIYKAPLNGGSPTLLLGNIGTYHVAVDANYVYFLGRAGGSNGLFRTPK